MEIFFSRFHFQLILALLQILSLKLTMIISENKNLMARIGHALTNEIADRCRCRSHNAFYISWIFAFPGMEILSMQNTQRKIS